MARRRAARLAVAAEAGARQAGHPAAFYVIGTEVPPPGGADHALDIVIPTRPGAALRTHAVHRDIFASGGLSEAFSRVIALVVQPGVEFGNRNLVHYHPATAAGLSDALRDMPGLVSEAHSTDYQGGHPSPRGSMTASSS